MSALLLGLLLGLRHAVDPDHVVVLSTLLSREPSVRHAVRLAALWGVGHSAAFLGVGLGVVLLDLRVPEDLELLASIAVGALLIGLGLGQLVRPAAPAEASPVVVRPLAVGIVHGLAGSAGVALFTLTTLPTRAAAAGHLVLFALGTVLGMVTLTVLLARPLGAVLRTRHGERRVRVTAAALGIALGLWILVTSVWSTATGDGEVARGVEAHRPIRAAGERLEAREDRALDRGDLGGLACRQERLAARVLLHHRPHHPRGRRDQHGVEDRDLDVHEARLA